MGSRWLPSILVICALLLTMMATVKSEGEWGSQMLATLEEKGSQLFGSFIDAEQEAAGGSLWSSAQSLHKKNNSTSGGDDDDSTNYLGLGEDATLWRLISTCILCFIGGALCAGTGIGGGGFYLPAYVFILSMNSHQAIPLSKATIFGLSSAVFCFNLRKRHPIADKPLIAYDVAQIMEPASLAGTIIGVILNIIVPSPIALICLVIVFTVTAWRTFQKATQLYHTETGRTCSFPHLWDLITCKVRYQTSSSSSSSSSSSASSSSASEVELQALHRQRHSQREGDDEEDDDDDTAHLDALDDEFGATQIRREEIRAYEARMFHWDRVLILVGIWFLTMLMGIIRALLNNEHCGDVVYWMLVSLQIILPTICAVIACRREFLLFQEKAKLNIPSPPGEPEWTVWTAFKSALISFFAGIIAAFLGIGGGLIKAPVLLELGLLPTVAAATSTFMIVFTASSSSLQYLMMGKLSIGAFAVFYCVGGLGGFAGQIALAEFLKRYKMQHIVSFLLGSVVLLSGFFFILTSVLNLVNNAHLALGSLCN